MTGNEAVADVSVVIVSHNGADWLERCLEAVTGAGKPTCSSEVVVVDSGSGQATLDLLKRWADRIDVVVAGENIGFAKGCNIGAARTHGRRVLLINPDALVRPGCVDALVRALDEHPDAGLVGGRTIRPDGSVDPSSCWGRPTLWSWFCFASGLSSVLRGSRLFDPESLGRWQRDTEREVDVVTGCLLITERTTWERLRGLDETYVMYGEDADLSLRAAAAGLHPRITPDAVAVHAVGASSGGNSSEVKTRLLFTGKATLALLRWSPARARLGIGLLRTGVAVRALGELVRRTPAPRWLPLVSEPSWARGWQASPAALAAPRA